MGGAPVSGNRAPGSNPVMLYLAAVVLRTAGFDAESIAKALGEIYGVSVGLRLLEGVKISPILRRLVETLTMEKLRALRYIGGAIIGDGDRYGQLRTVDESFARAYAKCLATLFDDPHYALVKKGKDGWHTRCCKPLAQVIREGLWKALAYVDRYDNEKWFLSGLLDAEGCIPPHVERGKLRKFQILFYNTNKELADFVMTTLSELLGVKPRLRVEPQRKPRVINGKIAVSKKPLYVVHVDANLSKISALTRLRLCCERKRKMLEFLLSVRNLPPHSRYEELLRHWKKWRGKWWPIEQPQDAVQEPKWPVELHPQGETFEPKPSIEQLQGETPKIDKNEKTEPKPPRRRRRHTAPKQRQHTIKCPKCGQKGTLTIHKGETVKICANHGEKSCELKDINLIGKESGGCTVLCEKCGKPGHIYISVENYVTTKKHRKYQYSYIRVRVCHHTKKGRKSCTLLTLETAEQTPTGAESWVRGATPLLRGRKTN